MSIMMKEMNDVKPTGDVDIDFLEEMIPHHMDEVEMSNSLLKYGGKDESIKKLAEDIINNQSKEIEQMKDMIKNMEASNHKDEEKEQKYLEEYNKMFNKDMNHYDKRNVYSVDKAFAIGMVKYHKMANDMSEIILKYTDNKDVINMANDIIKNENDEIKQMEDFVNN